MRITRRTRHGSISMGLGGWIAYGLFVLPLIAMFVLLQVTAVAVVAAIKAGVQAWRRRQARALAAGARNRLAAPNRHH